MTRRIGTAALILSSLTALGLVSGAGSTGVRAASPPVTSSAIAGVVSEYLDESGAPGAAVAVTRDAEILYADGVGFRGNDRRMTADTPLRVASLSKSFTAFALMRLVDQGQIELDETVATYLPEFSLDDPRAGDITVRHLLNHTSGMADAASPNEYGSGANTLAEAVRRLRSASLVAEPGTEWNYHNPNYHVAARVVEVVSRQGFDEYLQEHVFSPAGMDSTTSTATSNAPVPGLASGHTFAYGRAIRVEGPRYFTAGSGGVVSTARDMARWLILHNNAGTAADGRSVISPASISEMQRAQEPHGGTYGLGWFHTPASSGRPEHISHSGGAAAFSGYQVLYPGRGSDYGVVVLLNSGASLTGPTPTDPAQDIAALLGLDQPSPPDPSRALLVDLAFTLAGGLVLAAGWRGVCRAGTWSMGRRQRPVWRTLLRLSPYLLAIGGVAAVPRLQLLVMQRDAPWPVLFYVAPVVVSFLALAALTSAVVTTARLAHLLRQSPGGEADSARADHT